MHYEHKNQGTCSRSVSFDLEDGIIKNVVFVGGCDGNLKAIGKLVEGMEAEKVANILAGNTCGLKGTSCGDQLAWAIRKAEKK